MKVGIMQPYFFPFLGYFSLIKESDLFILIDEVQFIKHGWVERNRVLKQDEGWIYLKVPLMKYHQKTIIKDIYINNNQPWKQKIIDQLSHSHYKKKTPYFHVVINLLNELFEKSYDNITQLDKEAIRLVLKYLKIEKKILILSETNLTYETPNSADEWALNICKALGNVSEYNNSSAGQSFYDQNKYDKAGINLKFRIDNLIEYDQKRDPFIPNLSIIDTMMFNSPERINGMLDLFDYKKKHNELEKYSIE